MHCKTTNEVGEKIENIYQGDAKVKEPKLITLKTKMNDDETMKKCFFENWWCSKCT